MLVPFQMSPGTACLHTLDEELPSKSIVIPADLLKDVFVRGNLHIELDL